MIPFANESQPAFAIRFHEAMRDQIPETDKRDRAMVAVWNEHRGPSRLDRIAYEKFSRDHKLRKSIPVFKEHTIDADEDSPEEVYDRDALVAVLNRCNGRISDTGDFSPLCDGHTPTDPALPAPDVLGYEGPYRLGMVGNDKPVYAIFADEWHANDCVQRLQKLRRRSPEVWIKHQGKRLPMDRRFFDPVAALGSDSPFNDLGTAQYRQAGSVVRYSAAAAMPGAQNTFIPDVGDKRPYGAESMSDPGAGSGNVEQIVEAVLNAILELPQMKYIEAKMAAEAPASPDATPVGDEPVADDAAPPMDAPADPAAPPVDDAELDLPAEPDAPLEPPADAPVDAPADPPIDAPPDPGPPAEDEPEKYECDDEDRAEMQRYMAGESDDEQMAEYRRRKSRKKYAQPTGDKAVQDRQHTRDQKTRYQKMQDEITALRTEREAEKVERQIAERKQQVEKLRYQYAFNADKVAGLAVEKDKYGKLAMSDKAFQDALDIVVDTAPRHTTRVFPTPDAGADRTPSDKQATERHDAILRYCKASINSGKYISYEQAAAEMDAKSTGQPVAAVA